MMKNYFVRGALMLGAAAIIGTSAVNAEETKGAWRNMNHLLTNVSGINGWSGNATGGNNKIGEIFYGAGMFYRVIPNAPAGQYTLTAKAFNRAGGVVAAAAAYKAGDKTPNAYLFINDTESVVTNVFDEIADIDGFVAAFVQATKDQIWGPVDELGVNSLAVARTYFNEGKYSVTCTANHPGGDLYIGVRNYGKMGIDEWTAFGDFQLTGPNGAVELPEMVDFDKEGAWKHRNVDGSEKGRGIQNGGVWSKTNASPYNVAQTVSLEPGKYRLVMQSFNEYFLGSHNGYCIPMKGAFAMRDDIKSAKDLYDEGATELGSGAVNGTNAWNPTTTFKMDALHAYLFMYYGPFRQGGFDETDPDKLHNYWMEGDWDDKDGVVFDALPEGQWVEKKIMNIFDENLEEYPEANNYLNEDGDWKYTWIDENGDVQPSWWESGMNFEAAAFFVAHPDKYLNIVELEVTGNEPQEITLGFRKDICQNNYWHPVFDLRLEKWDSEYTGYQAGIEDVEMNEEEAPAVYYNLQGVRVANPANGLFIKKQGNKVSKVVVR